METKGEQRTEYATDKKKSISKCSAPTYLWWRGKRKPLAPQALNLNPDMLFTMFYVIICLYIVYID